MSPIFPSHSTEIVRLNGSQFKELHQALESAFPTPFSLKMLLRTGMDVNPESIAGGSELMEYIFNIIQWAEARGRLPELVAKACAENPGNFALQDFAAGIPRLATLPTAQVEDPSATKRCRIEVISERNSLSKEDLLELLTDIIDKSPRGAVIFWVGIRPGSIRIRLEVSVEVANQLRAHVSNDQFKQFYVHKAELVPAPDYHVQFRRQLFGGLLLTEWSTFKPLYAFLRDKWIYSEEKIEQILFDAERTRYINDQDDLINLTDPAAKDDLRFAVSTIEAGLFAGLKNIHEWQKYINYNSRGRYRELADKSIAKVDPPPVLEPQEIASPQIPMNQANLYVRLTNTQIQQLQGALLNAFPTYDSLRQMVYIQLNKNLDAITGERNLTTVSFELIVWAQANGESRELIRGARLANPGNAQLAQLAKDVLGE